MSTHPATPGPATCPYCNYPVPAGHPPLCLNCLHPLPSIDPAEDQVNAEHAIKPSEHAPAVGDPAAQATQEIPQARVESPPRVRRCPHCHYENAYSRVRCEQCAEELVPQLMMPPPPPVDHPSPRTRSSLPLLIVAAAVVTALVVGAISYSLTGTRGQLRTDAPTTSSVPPKAEGEFAPVPRGSIKASASSTLKKASRYSVKNTLDGDPKTAWNSDGEKVGAQAKNVKLTYTFKRQVVLRRIDIYNGYQVSKKVYNQNGRLRQVKLTTDEGESKTLKLADRRGRQTFSVDLGPAAKVTVKVEKVFRKHATVKDLALSEIVFYSVT